MPFVKIQRSTIAWSTPVCLAALLWACGGSGGGPTAENPATPELPLAQRLQIDGVADGHSAWSPDDTRIAYASFRSASGASIIVMSADGTELSNPTPADTDDNDPEYLPDGRIVFKTDRFSASPQHRIAVMNEDGSDVRQISRTSGVSDHDPTGGDAFVVFERFPKDTAFNTDVESGFVNWDLMRAPLSGSGESVLLSDGWINWLPVYGPGGQYIVYLKSSGYTTVHLLTSSGEDLGRLIPDITRISYVDWKLQVQVCTTFSSGF